MLRTRSLAVCLVAGTIAVAGMVCGLSVAHHRKAKGFYLGKPVEYWFNQLPQTRMDGVGFGSTVILRDREIVRSPSGAVRRWGSWIETPLASANAIRGIGTNALTFYLRKLRRDAGPREIQIAKAARTVGFEDFWIRDVDSERAQAVTAIILLKPLPAWVVSQLHTLSTNSNRALAAAARCTLTTKENALLFLHPPNEHSVDADLRKMPTPLDIQ